MCMYKWKLYIIKTTAVGYIRSSKHRKSTELIFIYKTTLPYVEPTLIQIKHGVITMYQ